MIGLAGNIKINILRGLFSWNLGAGFSPFGAKAKSLSMGASGLYVGTDNTTLAIVEPGAKIHTGEQGGLEVSSTEEVRNFLLSETGSESDGVGLGISGSVSDQDSVTLAQVAEQIEYEGGELGVIAESNIRPIVLSGSFVSSDGTGIGLSGSLNLVDRKTGAYLGAVPDDWTNDFEVFGTNSSVIPQYDRGSIHATNVELDATNDGDVNTYSVVSVIPTFRLAKSPVKSEAPSVAEELESVFSISIAGDAAINVGTDQAHAVIDVDGYENLVVSEAASGHPSLSIESVNDTKYVAAAGAASINSGSREGASVAVSGSIAWNEITPTATSLITDSLIDDDPLTTFVVAGNVEVLSQSGDSEEVNPDFDDTEASIWAVSGSLGIASAGGVAIGVALSGSVNNLDSTTKAEIDHVAMTVGDPSIADSGEVKIKAIDAQKITGDGGAFAISYNKGAGLGAASIAVGTSYAYNNIDYDVDAVLGADTILHAKALMVHAIDEAAIMNVTLAGGLGLGSSEISLSASYAGASNFIHRSVRARIGTEEQDEQATTPRRGSVEVDDGIRVEALDHAYIKSIATGIAFDINYDMESLFSGSFGASSSVNRIDDESVVSASIVNATIDSPTAEIEVKAIGQADIHSYAVQLGMLIAAGGAGADANGAISINEIGGSHLAEIKQGTQILNSAAVSVMASSEATIESKTIDVALSITVTTASAGVGLTLTKNRITSQVLALIDDSHVETSGQLLVESTSRDVITAVGSNAALAIQIAPEGVAVDVSMIGLVTLNDVDSKVSASAINSVLIANQSVTISANDDSEISVKGVGVQVAMTISEGVSVGVDAFVQESTNEVSTEVFAGIHSNSGGSSSLTTNEDVTIAATKQPKISAHLVTVSVGLSGSSGASVAIGGSDTTVINRLETTDGSTHRSATTATVSGATVNAANLMVDAISQPELSAEIFTNDIQAAIGSTGSVAAVAGVSTASNWLGDHVTAEISQNSIVNSTAAVHVNAEIRLPQPPDGSTPINMYLRGETAGVSASVSADLVSFAAALVGSYLNNTSQSVIDASIRDSTVQADSSITVSARDATKQVSATEDISIAASVVAVAAATPVSNSDITNSVRASIESTGAGSNPMTISAMDGDIDVISESVANSETSVVAITGVLGLGVSDDQVFVDSSMTNSVEAIIDGESIAQPLLVNAANGTVRTDAKSDDIGTGSVTSTNVSVGVAAFDFVKIDVTTTPTVSSWITGNTEVTADFVFVNALAEGHVSGDSKQRDFSIGFPIGVLRETIKAAPVVSAVIGESDSLDPESPAWRNNLPTVVNADLDVKIRAEGITDALVDAQMIGGALGLTSLTPKVTATVDPTVQGLVGQETTINAGRVISVEVHTGVDQNPHPGDFDASLGIDPVEDTIIFDLPHNYGTGDVLRYENYPDDGVTTSSNLAPVGGLEIGKQYRVIDLDDTIVQLGESIDSSVTTVSVDQDLLTFIKPTSFAGPFDSWLPDQWDIVSYRRDGARQIEGLVDGGRYWVNRIDSTSLKLYPYSEDASGNPIYPVAPLPLSQDTVQASQFDITNHGFSGGQAVTYRAAKPSEFSVNSINSITVVNEDGEIELTAEDTNFSSTLYLGDDINQFIDGEYVEYRVEATADEWYWVTGNSQDPHSDTMLGEKFWVGISGGDLAEDDSYANWASGEPNNFNGSEDALSIRQDGKWNDVNITSTLNYFVLEQPQFRFYKTQGEVDYYAARHFATQNGGWLPSIQTVEEYEEAVKVAAGNAVWLGGNDSSLEDVWHWYSHPDDPAYGDYFWQGLSDGYVPNGIDFEAWDDNQPDDLRKHTKHRNRETHLEMNGSGFWNDLSPDHGRHVLVELPKYKVVAFDGDFQQARQKAIEMGGWIARVPNAEINEQIRKLLVDEGAPSAWLGASRDQAINGLLSGNRYFVEFLNDTNHQKSVKLREVNADGTVGAEVILDTAGKVETITHTLVPVRNLPYDGLTNLQTYYVIVDSVNQFQLADSPENAALGNALSFSNRTDGPGSASTNVGRNGTIGTEGADLTDIGEGSHNLVYDISAKSVGTHSLQFVKLGSKPTTDATGTAHASAKTSGGALVAATGDPKAYAYAYGSTHLAIGGGAELHAVDIELIADSSSNVNSHVSSHTGGAASDNRSRSIADIETETKLEISGLLRAQRDIKIVSENSDNAKSNAETKGGGIVTTQRSDAEISESYQNLLYLLPGARLESGSTVAITATTTFDSTMTSETGSSGLFGDSKANQADGAGIRMQSDSETRNATSIILSDALIVSDTIEIIAEIDGVDTGEMLAHATGRGLQNKQRATGLYAIDSDVLVDLKDSTRIIGETLIVTSRVRDIDVEAEGHTLRGRAASSADAHVDYDVSVKVASDANTTIVANELEVNALQEVLPASQLKVTARVDRGSNHSTTKDLEGDRTIDWNATTLGIAHANLEIDQSGLITTADGVTLDGGTIHQGDQIPVGQTITVTNVPFDFTEQISEFATSADDASLPGKDEVTGDALFYAMHHVDFENFSNRDLTILDLDLTAPIENKITTVQFWSGESDGNTVNGKYANWNTNEPNDFNGAEDHAELLNSGLWNDLNGGSLRRYILQTDSGFELINSELTFADALNDAKSRGGTIASPATHAQNVQLLEIANGFSVWINLTDQEVEGRWMRPEQPSLVLVSTRDDKLQILRQPDRDKLIPNQVTIKNLQETNSVPAGDILFEASIVNPSGPVEISNSAGNLTWTSDSEDRLVIGREVNLSAPSGNIAGNLNVIVESNDQWAETIRHQRPNGYWPLSDPSGSVTADEVSGNGPDGTYRQVELGYEGAITGEVSNTSVRFSESTSQGAVIIPDDSRLHNSQYQTVTGWFKVDSFNKGWQTVYFKGDTPDCGVGCANRENALFINQAGFLYLSATPSDGASEITTRTADGSVQAGNWYHFATVLDASNDQMIIYLNGQPTPPQSYPASAIKDTAGSWYLGGNPSWDGQLTGNLDEFAIFNRVLSPDEVLNQYQKGKAKRLLPASVTALAGNAISFDITGEPDITGNVHSVHRISGGSVDLGLRRWNEEVVSKLGKTNSALDLDTNYVISGFGTQSNSAATQYSVESVGDITITGRRSDGQALETNLSSPKLLGVDVSAEIVSPTGQLDIVTNGDIQVRDGVEYVTELVPGEFTFAEALLDAAITNRTLGTVRGTAEQSLFRETAAGQPAWVGASDARLEGRWSWLTGNLYRSLFFEGDYRNGILSEGFVENWARSGQTQTQPDNYEDLEDFLVMLGDGTWEDASSSQSYSYVLETRDGFSRIDGPFTYADAMLDAYERQGWIATAESAEQLAKITSTAAGVSVWLGGTDATEEGLWEWWIPTYSSDVFWKQGNPSDAYEDWNHGEPNNAGGSENYMQLIPNGLWNDLPESIQLPYLATRRLKISDADDSRVNDIISTHGNVTIEAAGNLLISGSLQTKPFGTLQWLGDSAIRDVAIDRTAPAIQTGTLELGSYAGLGESDHLLTIDVDQIRNHHADLPVSSLFVDNRSQSLSLADLNVFAGDLLITTQHGLDVDGPIQVDGGGNLTLVANGVTPDATGGVAFDPIRKQIDFGFTNWHAGEPNNWNGNQNFTQMYSDGTWDDMDGNGQLGGYILHIDNEYSFVGGSFTWWQAANDAQSRGGQLAVIQSQVEQDLASQHTNGINVWIGGTDKGHEGQWKWVLASGYQNWNTGEPNNYNGVEHYAEMLPSGLWNDMPGTHRLTGYLLETEGAFTHIAGDFNWFEAYRDARSRGGHLATIGSRTEQDRAIQAMNGQSVWIGATDVDDPGNWKWIESEGLVIRAPISTTGGNGNINLIGASGIAVKGDDAIIRYPKRFWPDSGGYSNWSVGEPNNAFGGQNFAQMYPNGTWDDTSGSTELGGYILEINDDYSFVEGNFNWWEASRDAQNRGGQLAVIETASEQARAAEHNGGTSVWIGASDEGHEGTWTWIVGRGFQNWATNNPDNWQNLEHHGMMRPDGTWNDLDGNNQLGGYILEKNGDYSFVSGTFTWWAAKADAESRGGHLAVIENEVEQAKASRHTGNINVWFGATDEGHEGLWKWVDVPLSESNTLVSSSGYGQIVLASGTEYDRGTLSEGDPTAKITMEPGSRIASEFGNVVMLAAHTIKLGEVATAAGIDGRGGSVLIVADYDGVSGTQDDGEGTIRGVGDRTHVTADRAALVAEGLHDPQGWGIGRQSQPVHTQLNQLAAMTDFGDIAVMNQGDLTIGRFDIELTGVLANAYDIRSALPMKSIPTRISELDQQDEAPEYNNADGTFSIAGLVILDSGGLVDDKYGLQVETLGNLSVLPDTPVINLSAGEVVLSSFSDHTAETFVDVISGNFTWDEAFADAIARGGRLANLATPSAADAIETLPHGDYWIGASDALNEQNWYWTYPQPDGSTELMRLVDNDGLPWKSGDPNNLHLIPIQNVTASSQYGSRLATHTIDGSGLNTTGNGDNAAAYHVIAPDGNMWLSNGTLASPYDLAPEIAFDLGSVQDLAHMRIWNYNETLENRPELIKRGISQADILVAGEDQQYSVAIAGQQFDIAPGVENVDFSQVISLAGIQARYVKLDNLVGFPGADFNFVGLSEVRFYGPADHAAVSHDSGAYEKVDRNGSDRLGYLIEYPAFNQLDIQSRIFTSGGLNEIYLFEGSESYQILQPLPDETCDTYHYLAAQGDFTEGSKIQLSVDSCLEPTQVFSSMILGEGEDSGTRYFFSFDKEERDASSYQDGTSLSQTSITVNQDGPQTAYMRVFSPDGEYSDYQKTIQVAELPLADLVVSEVDSNQGLGWISLSGQFSDGGVADRNVVIINWGDQEPQTVTELNPAARNFVASHQYQEGGTYLATVTVLDADSGDSITQTVSVLVNYPPTSLTLSDSIAEEKVSGLVVGQLVVSDSGDNQSHVFSTSDPRFEIQGASLKLKDDEYFTYTPETFVDVQVTVTDSGTPPLSLTETFSIEIVANAAPWQNPSDHQDVSNDDRVTALDALLIINHLMSQTTSELPEIKPYPTPYYDVNADGAVTPLDALIVINRLDRDHRGEGEQEVSELQSDLTANAWFSVSQYDVNNQRSSVSNLTALDSSQEPEGEIGESGSAVLSFEKESEHIDGQAVHSADTVEQSAVDAIWAENEFGFDPRWDEVRNLDDLFADLAGDH